MKAALVRILRRMTYLQVSKRALFLVACISTVKASGLKGAITKRNIITSLEFLDGQSFQSRQLAFDERASALYARELSRARALQGGMGGMGGIPTSSNDRAASLLGTVAYTTVAGTDKYTSSINFPANTIIAGPFEAGFDSMIDPLLTWLGCVPASKGYLAGGIDTQTSMEVVAYACGVQLPRVDNGNFISLMWAAGAHSPPNSAGCTSPPGGLSGYTACSNPAYHYHQNFTNLYSLTATGHSIKIGMTSATKVTTRPIYGKYEGTGILPTLDACGGHFGYTPDTPSTQIYHHHVQDNAPFTVGCYGPNSAGGLVTIEECRSYYTGCTDAANEVTITSAKGTYKYQKWCPCYNTSTGLNAGESISGNSSPTTASLSTSLSTGGIIGIVIAGALLVAGASVLMWRNSVNLLRTSPKVEASLGTKEEVGNLKEGVVNGTNPVKAHK